MFWKSKPTIDQDEVDWQLETWVWLLEHNGGIARLQELKTALPSKVHFPPSNKTDEEHVRHVLEQIGDRIQVDVSNFDLLEQDAEINPRLNPLTAVADVPQGPAGTYSANTERHLISYSPSLLEDLEALIATLIHELCHPILLSIDELPPGGEEAEEFATDLAVAFFGFGVFGGNTAFRFAQFSDSASGSQGWSTQRQGYLTQNEWGFALALRSVLTDEDMSQCAKFMSSGLLANFRKNRKHLESNPHLFEFLKAI